MASLALAQIALTALAVGAPREFLVVHHGAMAASNIRALAQCATSSLLLRGGAGDSTRVWLLLPDGGLTVACDGRGARNPAGTRQDSETRARPVTRQSVFGTAAGLDVERASTSAAA